MKKITLTCVFFCYSHPHMCTQKFCYYALLWAKKTYFSEIDSVKFVFDAWVYKLYKIGNYS